MRRPLIAGNWKMHGTRASVDALVNAVAPALNAMKDVDMAVFPSFVFLEQVAKLLADSTLALGAQNVCAEPDGAFTGEVSAAMLVDVGCRYVLVGHSERRLLYGEEDATVAKKFLLAQKTGLIPVLCVGETQQQREEGLTQDVVARQLQAVMDLAEGVTLLRNAVVAYEPVWAIGTGLTATPEQAQEVHALIRSRVAKQDPEIAEALRIVYGGSVKAANARQLFAMADVDGGLVGGASLSAQEFIDICQTPIL